MKKKLQNQCQDFKIVLVGEAAVGKSCLLLRFIRGQYNAEHVSTVGVEFGDKILKIGDSKVKLQLWDTAGQEKFRSVVRNFYRHSSVVLLVYDITRRDTLDLLAQWIVDARENSPRGVLFIMVGTHLDEEAKRQVAREEAILWAQSHAISYVFQISSFTGTGVLEAFNQIATKLLEKKSQLRKQVANLADLENGLKQKDSILSAASLGQRHRCCSS